MARILKVLQVTALVVAIFASSAAAQDVAHVCLQYGTSGAAGSVYYDITTDASGTTMKRYNTAVNPAALVDSNWFAQLHKPANNGDYWSEGIDFVAAMQHRQVWINQEPNQPAYWQRDTNTGEDTWLFTTTINGAPITLTFRTSQCTLIAPPPTPAATTTTAAPSVPTPPFTTTAAGTAHVCLQYGTSGAAGSRYYDITTDASGTTMKRYNTAVNPPALVDSNWFAQLHKPANNGDYWSEGIDFVAAMQHRLVWINQNPNEPAYWQRDTNTGEDTWLFTTTINGAPITLTFRTSQCTL